MENVNKYKKGNAKAFIGSVIIYFIFIFIFINLYRNNYEGISLALLNAGSAISSLYFWRNLNWGKGKFDSFGAAILLTSSLIRIFSGLDVLFYGTRLDEIPFSVPLPEDLTFLLVKSEALSHFGTILLVIAWRHVVGVNLNKLTFLDQSNMVDDRIPRVAYFAGVIVEFLRRILGVDFGFLDQLSTLTFTCGVVSIYFLARKNNNVNKQIYLSAILSLPLIILSFGSGMKTNIFFPLIPLVMLIFINFKSTLFRFSAIIGGLIILAYSQLYVQYVRGDVLDSSSKVVSTSELIEGFQYYLLTATFADGLDSVSSRIDLLTTRLITVAIADSRGYEPINIFGPIPGSLVPRLFWPSKPVLQPGAQHTFRVLNIDAQASEATSATATGFFSELYLGGGYIGWALGAMIFGALLAKVQLIALRKSSKFGSQLIAFASLFWALRFEENHVSYAYTALFVYLLFIVLTTKFLKVFFKIILT